MRCVVTGGAGFLGSHLCERVMDRGDVVVCVDNLITGSMENLGHLLAVRLPERQRQYHVGLRDVPHRLVLADDRGNVHIPALGRGRECLHPLITYNLQTGIDDPNMT